MSQFFKKKIMKQFHFVFCCLLVMGLVLSLLYYAMIEQLMARNSLEYAESTAQKFNIEVEYLFEYADTLFNNLLFDENIERIMHTPFSSKTPAYLNALHTSFSSYRLMNPDLAEIALVTPEMSWSSYFDAATLRKLGEEMSDAHGTICFGLKNSPLWRAWAVRNSCLCLDIMFMACMTATCTASIWVASFYRWISPSPQFNCLYRSGLQPVLFCWIKMAWRFHLIAAMKSISRSGNKGWRLGMDIGLWGLVKLRIT